MTPKDIQYSENVTDRMIQLIEQDKILFHDLVRLLTYLFKKLNLRTIPNYAKHHGISDRGARNQLQNKRLMSVDIDGQIFVS